MAYTPADLDKIQEWKWTKGNNSKVWCLNYKNISCVSGVDGTIHPEGVVRHRRWLGLKLTAVIYLRCCRITCLTSLILSWLFTNRTRQKTRQKWHFSAPEVHAEILVPYARIMVLVHCTSPHWNLSTDEVSFWCLT